MTGRAADYRAREDERGSAHCCFLKAEMTTLSFFVQLNHGNVIKLRGIKGGSLN